MNARTTGYIPEIQGLRTLALLMVATFHIWFGKVSGGVDVFLLVSAYLLTRSLVARSERGSITRPVSYLVGKFSRLLPAAATAIALILVAVFLVLPADHWRGALTDALNSLFYVENIRLQDAAVDYFNADHSNASPFQHFWSLSVQGQVFVLLAVFHLLGDLAAKALRVPVRRLLLVFFAALAVVSFAYSVWLTDQNQAFAYFDTGARIWEFAVGSVLALVHPWLRFSPGFRIAASWVGVAAMLACGFILPVESSFPSWAALWPIGAASLIIISAGAPTRFGADRVLAHGVLNSLGKYTYALYLTHWPVLVLFLWVAGVEGVNWWQGGIVLAISAVLSFVIARGVEQPVARWIGASKATAQSWFSRIGWRRPVVLLGSIALVLGLTVAGNSVLNRSIESDEAGIANLDIATSGANAVPGQRSEADPVPSQTLVKNDWVPTGPDCAPDDPFTSWLCYEIPAVDGDPDRTIFTLGSSHTGQFNGTLLEAVNRHPNWAFRSQVAPGCYYQSREGVGEECVEVWDQGAKYIASEKPDLVVLFGTQTYEDFEMTQPDLIDWLREAREASPETQFVAMRDNPRIPFSLFECATQNGYESDECVYRYETSTDPAYVESLEDAGAMWVDVNDDICLDRECRPSRGGVVTYLDESHITDTYARTLAQRFTSIITGSVEWWPTNVYREGTYVDRATGGDLLEDLNG